MAPLETVLRMAEVTRVRADIDHLGPRPIETVNNALRAAAREISRLTQELEASRQREAEARDRALEEAAVLFDERASVLRSVAYPDEEIPTSCATLASNADEDASQIRALKSTLKSKDTQGGT